MAARPSAAVVRRIIGNATTPVMMSPKAAKYGNGPARRPSTASRRKSTAKTRPTLSPMISGIGRPSIAARAGAQALASAAATSGVATNTPMTGNGRDTAIHYYDRLVEVAERQMDASEG